MYKICEACQFWEKISDGKTPVIGKCKIDPPQIHDKYGISGVFPVTELDDWCGQWNGFEGEHEYIKEI